MSPAGLCPLFSLPPAMVHAALLTMGRPIASFYRAGRVWLLTGVVVATAVLGIRQLGGFERAELAIYDSMMQMRSPEPVDDRLLIVRVTARDVQQYGQFLPDDAVADLLERLESANPRVIGLNLIRDQPIGEGRDRLLDVLRGSDRIIATCDVSDGLENRPPPPVPRDQIGFRNMPVDSDGQVRRLWIGRVPPPPAEGSGPVQHPCHSPTEPVFSLSFQVVTRYLEAVDRSVQFLPNGFLQLGTTVLPPLTNNSGSYQRPAIEGYQLMLNPRSPQAAEAVLMSEVLSGAVPPEQIRDRIVLIGYTTPSMAERYSVPSLATEPLLAVPNVVLQAQITSQLLGAVLDNRPLIWFWTNPIEVLWIVLWAAMGGSVAWWLQRPERMAIASGVSAGVLGLMGWSLLVQGGWIPMVAPWIAFSITGFGVWWVDRGWLEALHQWVQQTLMPRLSAQPNAPTPVPVASDVHTSNPVPTATRAIALTADGTEAPATAQQDAPPPDDANRPTPAVYPSPTLERTFVPFAMQGDAAGDDYLAYVHQRLTHPMLPTDTPADRIIDPTHATHTGADLTAGSMEVFAGATLLDPAEQYLNTIRARRDRLQARRQSQAR